jgi:hypothetical protein
MAIAGVFIVFIAIKNIAALRCMYFIAIFQKLSREMLDMGHFVQYDACSMN